MLLELQSGKRVWAMTFPICTCCWRRSSAALATRNGQTFGTLQSCRARGQQATRYDKSATVAAGTTSKLSVLFLHRSLLLPLQLRTAKLKMSGQLDKILHRIIFSTWYIINNSNPENGFDKTFTYEKLLINAIISTHLHKLL